MSNSGKIKQDFTRAEHALLALFHGLVEREIIPVDDAEDMLVDIIEPFPTSLREKAEAQFADLRRLLQHRGGA